MNTVVFLGPSLQQAEACTHLDADYHPPVAQGDVYRAVQRGARIIGIVDGYFERVPAVWHKEILWALSRGVHVFGASSMGALRAAELAPFGMVGVGSVFEAFRDGGLEDDDEVTIAHGPAELGYLATSEAMVNIRATLRRAEDDGVIGRASAGVLLRTAKDLYYPLRTYPRIVDAAIAAGLPEGDGAAFRDWLPCGRRDCKREDAIALLQAVAGFRRSAEPFRAGFHFEHTDAWEQVSRRLGHQVAAAMPADLPPEAVLDELRLSPGAFGVVMVQALARALALREAGRANAPIARDVFNKVLNEFFARRGLVAPADISAWLVEQRLDTDGLTTLMMREVHLSQMETLFRQETLAQVSDVLRTRGRFGVLARRAEEKRRWLRANGLEGLGLAAAGLSEEEVLHWYFVERNKQAVPADLDRHSLDLGLPNRFGLLTLLAEEFLFCRSPMASSMREET